MVDIIIPVYNALDTLELAVTSALMQGNVRILLVDDGSTDGTARLCDELAHHPRIEVIHQRNHGVSAARNAGLQAAASSTPVTYLTVTLFFSAVKQSRANKS